MEVLKSTVVAEGFLFGESPRWRADTNTLWFVDMHDHHVLTMGPDGAITTIAGFDDHTSGLGFLDDGSAIVVLKYRHQVMRIYPNGATEVYADLSSLGPRHLNDMVVDPAGRAYVDTNSYMPGEGTPLSITDRLTMIAADGTMTIAADNLLGPNGLAISGDGRTLIVAEIRDRKLSSFDIDPTDGTLSNKQLFAATGADRRPDGICLDAEGAVWYACPDSHVVTRVLKGGEITHIVPVDEPKHTFACCLGGPDRRTLFINTAEMDSDFEPIRGYIETVQVDVPGDGIP